MSVTHESVSSGRPLVRVAFGWRAHEVERQSTAPVTFPDEDVSADILENEPVALAYAEPRHAFTLPPGRYVRVDQVAGRVYKATTTPHLDALTPAKAVTLADSVARLLESAGWQRDSSEGIGAAGAVSAAVRYASDGQGGFGVSHVGTWRVPRSSDAWAARPSDAPARSSRWDGVTALVTLRPVRAVAAGEAAMLILQVQLVDDLLGSALFAMSETRRARHGGDKLSSWDARPVEPLAGSRAP